MNGLGKGKLARRGIVQYATIYNRSRARRPPNNRMSSKTGSGATDEPHGGRVTYGASASYLVARIKRDRPGRQGESAAVTRSGELLFCVHLAIHGVQYPALRVVILYVHEDTD